MLEKDEDQGFVQWVADNMDHNIITVTSKTTFHGIGLTSIDFSGFIYSNSVLRLKEGKKTSSIVQNKDINILQLIGNSQSGLSKLKFDPILNFQYSIFVLSEMYSGWSLQLPNKSRPNWNDFMQKATIPNSCEDIKKIFNILPTNNRYQPIWWELHLVKP